MPTARPGAWLEQALERGLIRAEQLAGGAAARPLVGSAKGTCPLLDPPPAGVSEKAFMAQVVGLAEANGWRVFHTYDSRRSAAGWPDLALLRAGKLLLAELKTDVGKLSAAQEAWLKDLREVSGIAVRVWRPSLWAAIVSELATV